jgi:ribosome-binding factor A
MTTRRTAKVAAAIRQVVSTAILMELRDPRVKGVTVLNVEVPTDLRTAKVYITVLGDEKSARLSLKGLEAARGWIQSRIADELQLRLTPILSFVIDPGVKKSIEVSRLLREIQPPVDDEEQDDAESGADTADDADEDDAGGEEE